MLLLHGVLDPFPAGPALAAPVTQPGRQDANAQTQASGNQTPYASQLNQPVANFPGPVDPSTMQNMSYPPASTAQKSVPQPRQLNPRALEFKVGSAVNNLGASARPSALPTANSAPARPPGLLVTQQPQFASSNGHRGFLAPDTLPRSVDDHREAARAAAAPPSLITPYSSILPSPVPAIPQRPQLAPCKPHRGGLTLNTRLGQFNDDDGKAAGAPASLSALANNHFTASRDSGMASPSPLDLAAVSSSETNNSHLSPRQCGRRTSEHSSDASSHSSSIQDQPSGSWCLDHGYRCSHPGNSVFTFRWDLDHITNSSVSKVKTTKNPSHGPQNGEIDTGEVLVPSTHPPQIQPRYGTISPGEDRIRQNLRPSSAIKDKMPPWDPLFEYFAGQHKAFYSQIHKTWHRSAPPDAGIYDFYVHLQSLPEGLRWYHDIFGLRNPEGPITIPPPWSSALPSDTVSHHTKTPTVGNGMNTTREVAESDTSVPPTQIWIAPDRTFKNGIPVPISPRLRLRYGEEGSEHGGSSYPDPQPAIEVQLEAQSPVEEEEVDRPLQQRLNDHSLLLSNTLEEVRTTIRDMEGALG